LVHRIFHSKINNKDKTHCNDLTIEIRHAKAVIYFCCYIFAISFEILRNNLIHFINILFRDNGNIGEKRLTARNTSIANL
jgi:hypothetical protein